MSEPVTDAELPFLAHLRELRICLRNSILAVLIGFSVAFMWAEDLYHLLELQLTEATRKAGFGDKVSYFSLFEPMWTYLTLALYAGVFMASPVVFHQIWRFVSPGLYAREKRMILPFALVSGLLFIGGGLFCYYLVLPPTFEFLLGVAPKNVSPVLSMQKYFDEMVKFILGFGLVFETPLVVFFICWSGLATPGQLWRFNKYAIPINFFVAAVITPGTDITSQVLMALPIVVLYNLALLFAVVFLRKRTPPETTLVKTHG